MKKFLNPFIIKGYVSKEYFCDREKELEILHRNVQNGSNTTIRNHFAENKKMKRWQ